MSVEAPENRRRELAEFLRSRRARLAPTDVGLPDAGLRRTPGLRREEVAVLAGVGVTWYTWLEQGRKINPSDDVLASIARTLRLSTAETEHVFRLARVPRPELGQPATEVPPALRRLVDVQDPAPALLIDGRWDLLAWNRAAEVVFRFSEVSPAERNSALMMFSRPRARQVVEDWPRHARRLLGAVRASTATMLDDDRLIATLDRLHREHQEVRDWWADHDVAPKTVADKAFHAEEFGRVEVDEVALRPSVALDFQLVINLPRPSPGADRLAALL
jgi:transcriptional regulator with XRE-family HTH domain